MDRPHMDGFDVQALAWMIFFNLHRLTEEDRSQLADLATELSSRSYADMGALSWTDRILRPRSAPRSPETIRAAKDVLAFAIAKAPEVFGYAAVRAMMRLWFVRSFGALLACMLLSRTLALPLAGFAGWAVVILFMLSFAFFAVAVQRWFVSVMIRRLGLDPPPQMQTPP
ncbi:MAG TPA: hypothetical protein VLB83_00445 [Candidatus Paceibacterota bacterium]|nr:hypothetical protein [Candidatus Paceibacterota bacterium]